MITWPRAAQEGSRLHVEDHVIKRAKAKGVFKLSKAKDKPKRITPDQIDGFEMYLTENGNAPSTKKKYLSAVRQYASYLGDRVASQASLIAWRDNLTHHSKYNHYPGNSIILKQFQESFCYRLFWHTNLG